METVAQNTRTYDYTDENGNRLFQVVRKPPKEFRQRREDGRGGWVWNLQGVRLVPYRLHEISDRDTLFIVEGEKDVETLRAVGLMATCNPMGAGGGWRPEYTALVAARGVRDIIVIPDNDEPGARHAASVVASFRGTPCRVQLLQLPGLGHKQDVSDWFANGGTVEQLGALAAGAPYAVGGDRPTATTNSPAVVAPSDEPPTYGVLDAEDGPEEEPIMFPDAERPAPLGAAMHGFAADWVQLASAVTEADPAALLTSLLVGIGNIVGRDARFDAGGSTHHLNLFAALVGDTAKGRKGTSWALVERVLKLVDTDWATGRVMPGGLASGEGLIRHVGDDDPGVSPPRVTASRCLIVESEFGRVLQVMRREGNILSAVLRNAWDGVPLRNVTKENQLSAPHGHLSILVHVTSQELRRLLLESDLFNGFANRFLWVYTQRQRVLPHAGRVPEDAERELAAVMRENVGKAIRNGELNRAPSRAGWEVLYPVLSSGRPGVLGAVTSRAEAQVLRLAAVYAVLDGARDIRPEHLDAAADLWRYCEQSARFVFGESLGDALLDEALRQLREAGAEGITRTDLHNALGRNRSAAELTRVLRELHRLELAHGKRIRTGVGRPVERWWAGPPNLSRRAA